MVQSLLLATSEPALTFPTPLHRIIRWPDDAAQLVERQWGHLHPMLDAATSMTGADRVGIDEALALPGIASAAAIYEFVSAVHDQPLAVVGDPAGMSAVVAHAASVAYAEDRVAGMPLDIVSRLHPQSAGIPGLRQAGGLIGACRTWVRALRTEDGCWVAAVERGLPGDRAARLLSLIGLTVHELDGNAEFSTSPPTRQLIDKDDGYELRIPMRGVRKDALRLARAGEQLLVTADGRTVAVDIPAVLSRCRVTGASAATNELRIGFAIDERKWRS